MDVLGSKGWTLGKVVSLAWLFNPFPVTPRVLRQAE